MATREENIKKIEHELEALSDEELEQVAGGTYNQTAGDARFLNDLAGLTERYDVTNVFPSYNDISAEVKKGWSNFGISVSTSFIGDNKYFLDGKEISRKDAMKHAIQQYDNPLHNMNLTDY